MSRKQPPRFDYLNQGPQEQPTETAQQQAPIPQKRKTSKKSAATAQQAKRPVLEIEPQPVDIEQIEVLAEKSEVLEGARAALSNPEAFALPPQQRGRPPKEGRQTPLRTEQLREQTNVRLRPELKRAAAMLASGQGLSLGDVIEAALIKYLKEYGAEQGT